MSNHHITQNPANCKCSNAVTKAYTIEFHHAVIPDKKGIQRLEKQGTPDSSGKAVENPPVHFMLV